MANIALLEPFFSGSHKHWVEGFTRYTSHTTSLYTLPGRFWKWRMHGGAITLARKFLHGDQPADLILATDMLDLTTFQALTRHRAAQLPHAIYFHENQLTYPPPPGEKRNLHYGFINYTSMLAADQVFFNSSFHRNAFLNALPRLLKHFPDYNELATVNKIKAKSSVLPLGLDLQNLDTYRPAHQEDGPLRIVWNHRWEYDKKPKVFFDALYALQEEGLDFEIIVLGESFKQQPDEFLIAQERLSEQIRHMGYVEDFGAYARFLWLADVQVSCAIQDFFGASTCQAIYCDCLPLLPNRLNYPAFIPEEQQELCLYDGKQGLIERLRWACQHVDVVRQISLRDQVTQYDWQNIIKKYDDTLQHVIDHPPAP